MGGKIHAHYTPVALQNVSGTVGMYCKEMMHEAMIGQQSWYTDLAKGDLCSC